MADDDSGGDLPQAIVARPKRRRPSIVWIIPVLAAVVAIGIAIQRLRSEGPTITIVFQSAEGIEAGKTFIKYKDVNIGQVRSVQLTEDFSKVEVTAKITKRGAPLMVEDAKFWIVRPTVTLAGISGLNTLLSGNYIGFEAGKSDNDSTEFVGLDSPPFVARQEGREFVLKAQDLGSLSVGAPIYYRRLPVGQVISYTLAADGKSVDLRIFVGAPYDKFVTRATRFWKAGGIELMLDANGVSVHTESLVALLVGGLAFDNAPLMTDTTAAPADMVFPLYNERAAAMKAEDPVARHYVLHFNESLRGLSVGAPVTFLGLTAGEVTDVALEFDPTTGNVRPRVLVAFYPERLLAYPGGKDGADTRQKLGDDKRGRAFLQTLVEKRGLRAQLRSGNLLTGQLYVAFEYFPQAKKTAVNWAGETPELPVEAGTLVELEAKLTAILDKVDRLPLDAIAASLKNDLDELGGTLVAARKLIGSADTELVPSIKTDLEKLQQVLAKVERAVDNADATMLGPNAPAQQDLRDALVEFAHAARSIRLLIDYIERHPESPIRGKREVSTGGR